ncbi:MAG: hypothetical protein KKE94_08755, partial [Gammaproteobacteria bacterium]|nr:hypothetical protein [Gammaproteobacteria bacterium]
RLKAVQSVTIFYSERSEAFQSIFRNIDLASRCFSSSGFVLDSPVLGMVGVDENDNIHLVNFIKSILIG